MMNLCECEYIKLSHLYTLIREMCTLHLSSELSMPLNVPNKTRESTNAVDLDTREKKHVEIEKKMYSEEEFVV